jgi:hypothetical protein
MSSGHPPAEHPSNEDGVNIKKMVLVGVASLLIFAASAVIAAIILNHDNATYAARGIAEPGAQIGKPEIGIVDTVDFEADHRLEAWRAEKARVQGSYGWVDRGRGLIHIPIAQAMAEVVRQAGETGAKP